MQLLAGGIAGLALPQARRRTGEEALHGAAVSLLFLHPLAKQLADRAGEALLLSGRPHAGPARDLVVDGDGEVPHETRG